MGGGGAQAEGAAAPALRPPGGTLSTLGTHPTKESAPNFGFGTSTRENREKVFVSQEHAALASGSVRSPGPIYNHLPAVGPQPTGSMASAPVWVFGTGQRFEAENKSTVDNPAPGKYDCQSSIGPQPAGHCKTQPSYGFGSGTRENQEKVFISNEHNNTSDFGRGSPGPAAPYGTTTGVGKIPLSYAPSCNGITGRVKNASQPAWVMGKAERFDQIGSSWVPGPGQYVLTDSVGAQADSKKKGAPKYGFGSSTREHREKVFVSQEHASVSSGGAWVPGPGQYAVQSLTGKPVVAGTQKSGAAWGFGTSKRFADTFKQRAPGPGMYVV